MLSVRRAARHRAIVDERLRVGIHVELGAYERGGGQEAAERRAVGYLLQRGDGVQEYDPVGRRQQRSPLNAHGRDRENG